MIDWLNSHVGPDVATYLGTLLGLVAFFLGGKTIYNKWVVNVKNNNSPELINKGAVSNSGNFHQAARDIIINSVAPEIKVEETQEYIHDVEVMNEILSLIPYQKTIDEVGLSYLTGIDYDFSKNLEEAEDFLDVRFGLYNKNLDRVKDSLLNSVVAFNDASADFLHVDRPERKPWRFEPPYHWKNNGSEAIYREKQFALKECALELVKNYKVLIKAVKDERFHGVKL
jgi:hypothetical protein